MPLKARLRLGMRANNFLMSCGQEEQAARWKQFIENDLRLKYSKWLKQRVKRAYNEWKECTHDGSFSLQSVLALYPHMRKREETDIRTKMPAIGFELYQWFTDEIRNLKSRADSRLCINKAEELVQRLIDEEEYPKEDMPVISKHWFRKWRLEFGVAARSITTRFKVSMAKVCARVSTMLGNIFRLRCLWELCHPGVEMQWFSMDQKPSWFNNAGLKKTMAKKGQRRITVAEDYHGTLQRYTINTVVRTGRKAGDEPPKVAVLFKAASGKILKERISSPDWMLLQFQERGSYRTEDVVEFLDWALPQAHSSEESVVVLLDWFKAHLSDEVRELVRSKGTSTRPTTSLVELSYNITSTCDQCSPWVPYVITLPKR